MPGVYSLGVVLYELLTGELPFRGNQRMLLVQVVSDEPRPPRRLNDRIPRDLETICLKAMAKTPARRYASAQELADDLRRFLNVEPIRARPVGRTEKMVRWARRNPTVATLTTVAALLLLTVTAVAVSFAMYQRRANRELAEQKDKVEQARRDAEQSQREAEVRAGSAAVDIDLKFCEDGKTEYGLLRLARRLRDIPPHATALRQCVEMNLLAWAQELQPLWPVFQRDGSETVWQLSPDGLTVLTGGLDGTARLWDTFTGEVRATLHGHHGNINYAEFSQNGDVALTLGEDGTVRLWNTRSGQALAMVENTVSAWLSPDGRRLLTRSASEMELRETSTGSCVARIVNEQAGLAAAFSPDGRMLLTAGEATARLWSAETGRALATLPGDTAGVRWVAFSPDGSVIATFDGHAVRWWDSKEARQIAEPCTLAVTDLIYDFDFIRHDIVIAAGKYYQGIDRGNECTFSFIRGLAEAQLFVTRGNLPLQGSTWQRLCKADDDCVVDAQGKVYDGKSWEVRYAPAGRKFREELARFATNGRFLVLADDLLDLHTEKYIGRHHLDPIHPPVQYVSDRETFVALQDGYPANVIFLPRASIDIQVAQLFAEVVTCQELDPAGTSRPLDETTWDQRRSELNRRLDKHSATFPIREVALDKGHWLRRRASEASDDDRIKYLDRLIAVDAIFQSYEWRAREIFAARPVDAARDLLEAGRRAGDGYWHHNIFPTVLGAGIVSMDNAKLLHELILPPTRSPEDYKVALQLAEAYSHALPENQDYRIWVGIALYRLGRYADAVSQLEGCAGEWHEIVASQLGQFFLMGRSALLIHNQFPRIAKETTERVVTFMTFLAMAHHRLGHKDAAHAALDDLRSLGGMHANYLDLPNALVGTRDPDYKTLLAEAEALIEGRPQPEK